MSRVCLILIFLLSACANEKLTKPSQLQKLRVLTVIADSPEVAPGSVVQITPIVSDIYGGGRELKVTAYTCTTPQISSGAMANCDDATDRQLVTDTTYNPAGNSATMIAPHYTGSIDPFNITVPADFLSGKTAFELANGAYYLVDMKISSGQISTRVIKRVTVSLSTNKNTNPTIDNVLFNGTVFSQGDAYPTEGEFKLAMSAASSETFDYLGTDGKVSSFTESISVRYFTHKGEFSLSATSTDSGSTFKPVNSSTNAVIGFLATDGRGGNAIVFRRF